MRKINIFTILLAITFSMLPGFVLADTGHSLSIKDVLAEIRESQGVETDSDIECNKVTDEQFEKLGETYMSLMHPDEQEHELMDKMMGGEGSESLKAMHIMMGQNYLGCSNYSLSSSMMGVMPSTVKNPEDSQEKRDGYPVMGGMMGFNNYWMSSVWMWFGWIFMILIFVLVLVAIIALVRWLLSQQRQVCKKAYALEILKERYAKGEIDKKEFVQMAKEIEKY